MAGETEEKPSGWTVDTLHAHFKALLAEKEIRDSQRFDAQQLALRDALLSQEKAVNAALQAAQQAVTKAEIAAEKRLDAVNEFRGQLSDQAATLMPRSETMVLLAGLGDRLAVVEKRTQEWTGRGKGLGDAWGYLLGAAGFAVAVISIVIAATR